MTRSLIYSLVFIILVSFGINAQNDWHTYPVRSIDEILSLNPPGTDNQADIVISAKPFPSKTSAVYLGKRRNLSEHTKNFIKLWVETRNVPAENANLLVEEMLFKTNNKELWIPVITRVSPLFDKELKAGEEITIYYFFLGGYNPKKLQEKSLIPSESKEVLRDEINWVFAIEAFQKDPYKKLSLSDAIDKNIKISDIENKFIIDSRQLKNKATVVFTGEVRKLNDTKSKFIEHWLKSQNVPLGVADLLTNEMRFMQDGKDYWMPVRKSIMEEMQIKLKKGDSVEILTILAGGIAENEKNIDWIFIAGEFTK